MPRDQNPAARTQHAGDWHHKVEELECPVCFDIIKPGKGVKCQNKHTVCEKHFISRAKAIYSEGAFAFQDESTDLHRCFMCRCDIPDTSFSNQYFKLLHITQCFVMGQSAGKSKDYCHRMWEECKPVFESVQSQHKSRGDNF